MSAKRTAPIPAYPYGPDGLKKPVSTRNVTDAVAAFPARSTTVIVTVCEPSERPVNDCDVVDADRVCGFPPSMRSSM